MSALPTHPAPATEIVRTARVACDGGEGALGHPRVWISIPLDSGWADCGYCDKRFILEGTEAANAVPDAGAAGPGGAAGPA